MPNSALEQYTIADLFEWYQNKRLVVNPVFQRRSVWTTTAKVFLIDTILRRLPIPKIYIRQKVDLESKQSYREVVDGQQRLRAIFEFASDRLTLTSRAGDLAGHRYTTLDADLQEAFLSYPLAVEHLINATDDDVLEVFSRLNSYTLPLNGQEERHAKYQGDFKWTVHEYARRWSVLWDQYGILSTRNRVRMGDDELMAQMFGILISGVTDGGQSKINGLYTKLEQGFDDKKAITRKLDSTVDYMVEHFGDILESTPLGNAANFPIWFAAVAHGLHGIPAGDVGPEMPNQRDTALTDLESARNNLLTLADILDTPESNSSSLSKELHQYWAASRRSTQRISSRKPRFIVNYRALQPTIL